MPTPAQLARKFDPTRSVQWASELFRFPLASFEKLYTSKPESFWTTAGEQRALLLFQRAAAQVPAYKKFLRAHRIRPELIRTMHDFAQLPETNKENYIHAYPLTERCWNGKLPRTSLIAASSGTTGVPVYWPRGGYAEFEASLIHLLPYRAFWNMHRTSTLVVIGFPMGSYVSGVATLLPTWLAAQHPDMQCTVVSCGNRKEDILEKIRTLAPHYQQVVLTGHPFLVKDVIETGAAQGVRWDHIPLRTFLCSEGFAESWRSYLRGIAHMPSSDTQMPIMSTYGSSEMLLMGTESPRSIAIREALTDDPTRTTALMGVPAVPNLFQYNPLFRYIESQHEELLFTCSPGIPLIRFNLHDSGRVFSAQHMIDAGIRLPKGWNLPFVALNGRSDHTAIFNAANIYPEHVHAALNHMQFLPALTGKFVLRTAYDTTFDGELHVHAELQANKKPSAKLCATLQKHIVTTLRTINTEFADMERAHLANKKRPPTVIAHLEPHQHPTYFPVGTKPRYIAK